LLYHAYGLILKAEFEFPELRPAPALEGRVPDVTIRLGEVARRPESLNDNGNGIWCDGDQYCHYREGTGACLVTGGTSIVVDREGDPDDSLVRLSVLGPAMGLALIQRGLLLLHASAVSIDGAAVAFLGNHGAGKSTMAASLHSLGHPLITDDIAALDPIEDDFQVLPTFPQLKLWDNTARDLGLQPDEMPRVHPDFDKWAWRLDGEVSEAPLPLRRLYVLGVGDEVKIENLEAVLGSQYVIRNWYGARFGVEFYQAQNQGEHFRRCIGVADAVPMRRLLRPEIESGFDALAREIEAAVIVDLAR
jgi:energy-coupling factor transporter ATP-binding protein EcfA2